jgi:uncharacterized protein
LSLPLSLKAWTRRRGGGYTHNARRSVLGCATPIIKIFREGKTSVATSSEWHEGYDNLSERTLNFSRALKSLQEELEAVDWYNQRAEVTKDDQLRRILEHNRNEEIEHAMMALEYLRRMSPVFDKHMRTYLFTEGDITEIEEVAEEK